MPYYDDDGHEIDPSDVPIPDLCRFCTQYLDPAAAPDPDSPDSLESEAAFDASMQIVHCTLTRIDHHLDAPFDDHDVPRGADRPFTCTAFRSRFGGTVIWH
jgi:hypothetical protein